MVVLAPDRRRGRLGPRLELRLLLDLALPPRPWQLGASMTCASCRYWWGHSAFKDNSGTRYAPCDLKPDKVVRDRRYPSRTDVQSYLCSETYSCPAFRAAAPRAATG